ncbi:MAG TPA: hypothetical protein VED17_03130, partial [Nitrososphaerales archaeon]|nr:hypothetical protein [Nitrososphaerales archaeon]
MDRIKRTPRKYLLIIVATILIVIVAGVAVFVLTSGPMITTTATLISDYSFFVIPNAQRVEAVREWLM